MRAGGFDVVLTRDADEFVSLERRVATGAPGAGGCVPVAACRCADGARARGASVYTLSDSASDAASAALAERHNRADILAGVDLSGKDDVVADVLMDLARMETQPRSEHLARQSFCRGFAPPVLPLLVAALASCRVFGAQGTRYPVDSARTGVSVEPARSEEPDAMRQWRAQVAQAVSDALGDCGAIADAAARRSGAAVSVACTH